MTFHNSFHRIIHRQLAFDMIQCFFVLPLEFGHMFSRFHVAHCRFATRAAQNRPDLSRFEGNQHPSCMIPACPSMSPFLSHACNDDPSMIRKDHNDGTMSISTQPYYQYNTISHESWYRTSLDSAHHVTLSQSMKNHHEF